MTLEDKKNPWPWAVGVLMMRFASIEAIACQWIYFLTKDQSARDKSIGLKLIKRVELIRDLIPNSALSDERKKKALELWSEVVKLSKTRNKIAHGPFITEQNRSGFIDIREMKGVLDGHPILIPLTSFSEIVEAGTQLAKIIEGLIKLL